MPVTARAIKLTTRPVAAASSRGGLNRAARTEEEGALSDSAVLMAQHGDSIKR